MTAAIATIQQRANDLIHLADQKHSENVIIVDLKKLLVKLLTLFEELQRNKEEGLVFESSAASEIISSFDHILSEMKTYFQAFEAPRVLSSFLQNKHYSIQLIQIHQSWIAVMREMKAALQAAEGSRTNIDNYFIAEATAADFNSKEYVKRFNSEFFATFLFLKDAYIVELIELSPEDKYELFNVIFTEITSDQMTHLLAEVKTIKDANSISATKQRLRNIFALHVLEEPIEPADITINTNDVIVDGQFGKICLGTLKNSDLYSTGASGKKTGEVPVAIACEMIYMNESYLNKQRFGREIDALRKLSNAKCVLKFYGWIPLPAEQTRPVIGIITEKWHRTLTSLVVDETFAPTIDVWLRYLLDIAKALGHIKRSSISYRTLKADSIVITAANTAVISDLSLTFNANYITTRTTVANTVKIDVNNNAAMVGSMGFVAPEVYKGKVYDTTDTYSFGIVVAFVLLRESPWADENHVVTYSPQMTREPRTITASDYPSFQAETITTLKKSCDQNYKNRCSLAEVEKVLKVEYGEVSKQLRVLQKTKSQLNVMNKVEDIATLQGVPVPKVPVGAITASSLQGTPAASKDEVKNEDVEVTVIPDKVLNQSADSTTSMYEGGLLSPGSTTSANNPNNQSFLSVLSEIPATADDVDLSDDDSIAHSIDPQATKSGEGLKALSQEDEDDNTGGSGTGHNVSPHRLSVLRQSVHYVADNMEVMDASQYPLRKAADVKLPHQDSSETIDDTLDSRRVKFNFQEEHQKTATTGGAPDDVEYREINLTTYRFEVTTVTECLREIRVLQHSKAEYSTHVPLVHSILLRIQYFLDRNPSETATLLLQEKVVLYELISYYQVFIPESPPTDPKTRTLLSEAMMAWLLIFIRFTYHYEDESFQQAATPVGMVEDSHNPGMIRPQGYELTITNQLINHYHAVSEVPINRNLSQSNDPSHPPPLIQKVDVDPTKTHVVPVVPYFHYERIQAVTNQQLLSIVLWLVEQILLDKGGNGSGGIYSQQMVLQIHLLQLLLILLFPKENKHLFTKQSGLKVLLLLLTKCCNHHQITIVHYILLMVVNLFFQEENIIKLGKLPNSCEIITNVINYHKVYIESNAALLRQAPHEMKDNHDENSDNVLFYYHANMELLLEIVRDLAYYIEFQYEFSQFQIVGIIVDTLSLYTYHPQIVLPANHPMRHAQQPVVSPQQLLLLEKALEAVICLSMNDTNELQFGEQGICELLTQILRTYGFQYSKITENSFNAIRNLSKNNDNKVRFCGLGMCELVIKLLTHYIHLTNKRSKKKSRRSSGSAGGGGGGSGSVSGDDVSDTGSLASETRKLQITSGGSAGGGGGVSGSGSQDMIKHVFPAGYAPSKSRSDDNVSLTNPATGPNPAHEIIKSGLSAITNLSVYPENKERFGNSQACELIIIILYLFGKKSLEITKKALAAIGNLSVIPENKIRFANNIGTNINQQMVTIHPFEVLVGLLKKYALQNIDVSKKGLAAVGNLSVHNDNKVKLGQVGINKVLVEILRIYAMANEEVAQNGLGALANLAAYSANSQELMAQNIDALVVEIMLFYEKRYQLPNQHAVAGHSDHNLIYLEILKNGFGAINKFINNHQMDNIKKFSNFNLPDGIVNLLKKLILNYTHGGNIEKGGKPSAAEIEALHQLGQTELMRQMFQTIAFLLEHTKNIKKFRNLELKDLLKKYFADHDKAHDILLKLSRKNSLFWGKKK